MVSGCAYGCGCRRATAYLVLTRGEWQNDIMYYISDDYISDDYISDDVTAAFISDYLMAPNRSSEPNGEALTIHENVPSCAS